MFQVVLGIFILLAQQTAPTESSKPAEPEQQPVKEKRTELNLLGATDSAAGESRRNENVQFNLIDNNALKDLKSGLAPTPPTLRSSTPTENISAPSMPTN